MTTLDDVVSHNVRLLSVARGTTPTAIARELGQSHQWLQAKIAGRNRWTVDDLGRVADALDVTPGELVDDRWSLELVRRPRQDESGSRPVQDESRGALPRLDSNQQPSDYRLAA